MLISEAHSALSVRARCGLETRIPADHPLRPIRKLVDEALLELSPAFSKLYAREGGPIPPERLLRALLLQTLYTVRPERMLMPLVCDWWGRVWRPVVGGVSEAMI